MNRYYDPAIMDIETKARLARTGSIDIVSSAIRLRAALKVANIEAQQLAAEAGVTKAAISNATSALSFPNRDTLKFLFHAHRLDYNFMMGGQFAQLPGDVQDRIFPALEAAEREWDQRESSDRGQEKTKLSQQRS